ncbi:MAG: glycosyltransferase family 4 protein [Patescibacteria group bacterium]
MTESTETNDAIRSNLIVINKQKKILVATGLYPPDIGGPATYSKLLKEELPKASKDKLRVIILNFGEVRHWPLFLRHLIYFGKALYRGRFCDVIYAQDPVSVGLPALWAAKLLRKPFLLKIVGDYAWEQAVGRFGVTDHLDYFSTQSDIYGWYVRLLKTVQTFVAKQAKQIIVPSRYLKKIVSNWGVDPAKIIVIYNAFDEPTNMPAKEALRQKLDVTGEVIVSAGRLVPWKGFDTLVKIMPAVQAVYPKAKLLIIGAGPIKKNLAILIKRLGLLDSVLLTGQLEHQELLTYLRLADVFVLNTAYEGFSHLLLEVAAMGTPMITTRLGGNPEVIEDGKSGLLINYNDSEAWKSAILKVFAEPELAKKISLAAAIKIKNFSTEKMINETIKLILSCAS